MYRLPCRGYSMIGLLVTMVCIVILFVIGMSAMNKAVTGEGSALENTVRSVQDQLFLAELHKMMVVAARDNRDRFITPSEYSGSGDRRQDTTANLFSSMLMQNYTIPAQLISGNEYNNWVRADEDYNMSLYDPRGGVYWDPSFVADLEDVSNVSFAHMPLFGGRFDHYWEAGFSSRMPILGNRGPRDGVDNPMSYTYGRNGQWGGHIVMGDGSVRYIDGFTPGDVFYESDGQRLADNIFAMESGPEGDDAILSFTRQMTEDGPMLQHD